MTFAQTTVTFEAAKDKSASSTATPNVTITKDGVTIQAGNGIFGNGKEYRIYKGQLLTITSTEGNIQKIEFTCTANDNAQYGPGNFTNPTAVTPYDTTGINGIEANVNNNNAIFNIAGQRLQKLQKGLNIVGGKKIIVK